MVLLRATRIRRMRRRHGADDREKARGAFACTGGGAPCCRGDHGRCFSTMPRCAKAPAMSAPTHRELALLQWRSVNPSARPFSHNQGREMWCGFCRSDISVSAPFVWRCLSGSTVAPFPHPAHRTGRADFPHPALGQDLTPSPTARCARAQSSVRAHSARKGARVDKSRPCVA